MSELSSIPTILSKGKVARALYSPRLFFSVFVVFSGALKSSRKKTRKQKMGTEENRKVLLTRVRQVTPWNVEAIVSKIMNTKSPLEIEGYVNGSDAEIHALVDATKNSMVPSAVSLGREFPAPFWISQGQSSDGFEGFQAASAGQIGTSQHPGSSSVPDDRTRDFLHPSSNSQAQSSGTSAGIQSATAGQIVTSQIPEDNSIDLGIEDYVNGSDAEIHALVDATKNSMVPSAVSLGREFPAPFWNSQGQSSDAFEGFQAASAGQIGTSQHPSVPDDRTRDFPHPSSNSRAQSSGTSAGIQSATAGQIVTSQIPDDKSIDLNEHSQSSSVPRCSNITGHLPSTSRSWPNTCDYYFSRRGLCKKGLSCKYSHGFGPSGKLEMQIRQLLLRIPYRAVFIEVLLEIYSQCYKEDLPVENNLDLHSLLRSLHTIIWIPDRHGRHLLALLENYQAYIGYSADRRDWDVREDEGHTKIYICFSAASRSICTEENVHIYFSQYGPVLYVTIPHHSTFGFVRFQYPGTVRLLLSEWNPQVPHFICGAAVRVDRYIPKGEPKLKNTAGKHGLDNGCNPRIVIEESSCTSAPEIALPLTHSQPSDTQMEIVPLEGGEASGPPGGNSADNSQPSHSQVEIYHPEVLLAGLVPDGLGINPVEGGEVLGGLEINPLEGGEASGPPDENSADNSQPSHSQVEIYHPEAGLVPDGLGINPVEGGEVQGGLEIHPLEGDLDGDPADGQVPNELAGDPEDGQVPGDLDGDSADEHIDDEIVARLPDVSCFYKQT